MMPKRGIVWSVSQATEIVPMASPSSTGQAFQKLGTTFKKHSIPTDAPGFYDHPNFVMIEQRHPEFLDNYARFINWRSYDAAYLKRAEQIIRIVTDGLHRGLLLENRLGGCMDTSMALARILDRHGVWNYIVKGSLCITFPLATGLPVFCFWPVDPNEEPGKEYGHKWVFAPPFDVIDLTLKLQEYDNSTPEFLPDRVMAIGAGKAKGKPEDIIVPGMLAAYKRRGIDAKEALAGHVPNYVKVFAADFPAYSLTAGDTRLKYVPIACGASDSGLEKITSYSVCGKSAFEFYEAEIRPQLTAAGY